jgi:hypothetical protein
METVQNFKIVSDKFNVATTAPSGRELYYLQFLFQADSPETFGYTLVSK